ncbi:MAG: reverse transcriptase domain-containing protein [Actinomycetota bacterium]
MQSNDVAGWLEAIEKEHDTMEKCKVWTPRKLEELPEHAKYISNTWAMKLKASGVKRARCTARGFQQEDKVHCDSDDIAAPVVNNTTIKITFVLMILAMWVNQLVDVKGALHH